MNWKLIVVTLALIAPAAAAAHALEPATPVRSDTTTDLVLELAHAHGVAVAAPDLAPFEGRSLRTEILTYYGLVGAELTPRGLASLDAGLAELPEELHEPTALLLSTVIAATIVRDSVFAGISADDATWASAASQNADLLTAADIARLDAIGARIDLARMVAAGALTIAAVERATDAYRALVDANPTAYDPVQWTDPLGIIEVSGTQDNVHARDLLIGVDLGGNDLWSNNAGATMPDFIIQAFPGCITTLGLDCTALWPSRNGPAMQALMGRVCSWNLVTPAFVGADYATGTAEAAASGDVSALAPRVADDGPDALARAAESAALDTGCLPQGGDDVEAWTDDFITRGRLSNGDEHSVTVAIDVAGDDVFAPPKTFNNMNNGGNAAGCDYRHWGEAGKIIDRNLTAGSAFAGVGVLFDGAGNDYYEGRSLTQGVGHVGAVGIQVDDGDGDDHYAGVRFAQGMALFVALGLLDDRGGNDRYELKNNVPFFNEFEAFVGCDVSTRDGQGRANFNGIAALVEHAGDDVYYTQDHIAEGLFLPGASRDDATTTQGSTGFRLNIGPSELHDLAAAGRGLLWDRGGLDAYSRPGRGDGCFDSGGSFLDQQDVVPSTRPCA